MDFYSSIVKKEKQTHLRSALSNLQELNFNFDVDGSKIIYQD